MTNVKKVLMASVALTMISGAAWAAGNDAEITQTGNKNETTITQTSQSIGHSATADVTGNRNNVLVLQTTTSGNNGVGNADITIDGPGTGGNQNAVNVTQQNFQQTSVQEQNADIDIYGSRNEVNTTQNFGTSFKNEITIALRGSGADGSDNNNIDVTQTDNDETASVTVYGDRNDVDVDQRSGAGGQTATVYIDGTAGDDEGDGNKVNIKQSYANLSGSGETFALGGNNADVSIYGDRNNSSAFSGVATSSLASANGLNPGDIVQTGRDNNVDINVGSGSVDSNNNRFAVSQRGDSNDVFATILGDDNELVVAQNGVGNSSISTQIGSGNIVAVSQSGNDNSASVTQTGDGNIANVGQTGGMTSAQ